MARNNYKICFGDIQIPYEATQAIIKCLQENDITIGTQVYKFEEDFGKLFNAKCSAVNNGTEAIFNAFLSIYPHQGIERNNQNNIIVPALGFIATSNAVLAAGFQPNFVDIERETLNLDHNKVEAAINENTVAICAVSTMGKPCKMDRLRKIANKHNLMLICDNAEGHGCRYKDAFMEDWADICTYSFYVAHLICGGEFGAVTSRNPDIINIIKSTRGHGRKPNSLYFDHEIFGWNSKPTNLNAALANSQIKSFWEIYQKRKANLIYLIKSLKDKNLGEYCYFNLEEPDDNCCPHALSITFKDNNEERFHNFYNLLNEKGIEVKLNFKSIPTQQKSFAWMEYVYGTFPEAEFVGRNGLHLACHQYLSQTDLNFIVCTICESFNSLVNNKQEEETCPAQ